MTSQRHNSFGRWATHFLATGFGAGRAPFAPGTFGTLVAIPIYLLLREAGPALYAVAAGGMFVFGVWLCGVVERDTGQSDAGSIVWDEIVGYLVSMFMAPPEWGWIAFGFVLFRVFDIVKPFPIRRFEQRVPGGLGVMLDDVLAGLYVLAIMQATAYFLSELKIG